MAVVVRSFRHVAQEMKYPRAVITQHPMGRPMGPPEDSSTHDLVVAAGLELLTNASAGSAIVELHGPYRPVT